MWWICFFLASADEILEQLADESVVDLRSHWPILPLIQINLYNIPPQPKKIQEWTIMQSLLRIYFALFFSSWFSVVDDDNILVPYPYPSDPQIAEQFYEEFNASKNKPPETDAGKGKTEEKVKSCNSKQKACSKYI